MLSKIALDEVRDVFFSMEENDDLFQLESSDGVFIWNACRLNIYQELISMYGVGFVSHDSPGKRSSIDSLKRVFYSLRNAITFNYLSFKQPKYLFITAQRIKIGRQIVDNISDHLIGLVDGSSIAIELLNKNSVSYPKMILGMATRLPPVFVCSSREDEELDLLASKISTSIFNYFGVRIDVRNVVAIALAEFRANYKYFSKLFAKYRPRAVIGVNNNLINGLYAAAREFRIPAIELQHGASSSNTLLWSYPKSISNKHPGLSLPTAYLTFSEYWVRNTNYPVKVIRSIGNDNLYQKIIESKSCDILVVSAYMYHDCLVSLIMDLAGLVDKTIYFKLHPHEYYKYSETIAKFESQNNVVVVAGNLDFPSLYGLCDYVVGVHSTTLYQALQAGKKVCLYKRSNYFWHSDIFDYVELFDSAFELARIVSGPPSNRFTTETRNRLPLFYSPFDFMEFKASLREACEVVLD